MDPDQSLTPPTLSSPSPGGKSTESLLEGPPTQGGGGLEENQVAQILSHYLKQQQCYDVLPISFRAIVLDSGLLVKKALAALLQNGVASAPIWDPQERAFAGLLTVADFINLIQYFYQHSSYTEALEEIEQLKIHSLRGRYVYVNNTRIEEQLGVPTPAVLFAHPSDSLYHASKIMVGANLQRLALVEKDSETGHDVIIAVLTQSRILRSVASNYKEKRLFCQSLAELKIGTFRNLATATMSTPVIEIINTFIQRDISAVPIVNENNTVLNVYEHSDVMILAYEGAFYDLDMPAEEALLRRPEDFEGVHTCRLNDTLLSIFDTIRQSRVRRFIVVDSEDKLLGIVSLSDILSYLIV
ncbi:the adenylate sensor from Amp activated protein kinase complexed with Amp [Basidiobolus meristosporus CBS 931.73]|uniref:The adenylate sensor from Amp activated protein kinase complexed with Amp n=1 Tax=Basidiobolus meristosporus CBS 931.73 TaxID=1314790 RepID=A0A1Y1XV73_9FUNG|nr:the adenylate sensor from Amp activated protein kinase complexed with Amp [Basidiobolus meristosporus CBS 931.73]|eukprot:ORX89667.1 the adenylate sensor from Amp activated protein kinase complexed with Amp [Basidiobolus meristosporus CBS 931.73]